MGREGIPGKPLEEVTFDQRGLKELSKQALDGTGRKRDPKPIAGPSRVLELPQFRSPLQVWGGRGRPGLRRGNSSEERPVLPGPPRSPGECTQQEGRG